MSKLQPAVSQVRNDPDAAVTSVPLLDLKAQYAGIRDEVRLALDRVCDAQEFILGRVVAEFESSIAAFVGARHAVGVSSGTDALLVALMALNVGAGDEVITTPYSFFATAGVIARLGARPVFVDIDPATYNIDVAAVAGRITGKTKVIMPVHLFGRCTDMDALLDLAAQHGIPIVEDAAQALGALDNRGRAAGTVGNIGCYSFFPSKNLGAFGDGGMVVMNDDELAEAVRIRRVHGSKPKYHHRVVGGNFRLDALQAAVLAVKLPHLPDWARARRQHADDYRRLFAEAGLEGRITLPGDVSGHVYNQFVIRAPARDRLQAHLRARNIGTEVYYPRPLHLQECFADLGYNAGDFIHSETAARETLALPVYPELTAEQQRYVVASIAEFFREDWDEAAG
jgi:dTDP-4-amino-4,6-dideoxygalactose transaminase